MVHRRELDSTAIVLGNQGDLFGNAMTWWDHETGSVWSQPLGEAIMGPRKGATLELYPSTLTTWAAWLEAHPGTEALDVRGWATGFHLEDMVVVVDRGQEAAAYRIPQLRLAGLVNTAVGGLDIAVVTDPYDPARWAVFSRRLDNVTVELEWTTDGLTDKATGTIFDPVSGRGVSGPLSSQSLDRVPGFTAFPEDFLTFFPDGEVWPNRE